MSPTSPPFTKKPGRQTKREAQGVRYERKVLDHLEEHYGESLLRSPWFQFHDTASGVRWCQPDALLIDLLRGQITIVEVKYQHTADAWWQLQTLYAPVVRALFPPKLWHIALLEIVKWYDPQTAFPTQVVLCPEIRLARPGSFGVHIWKP